MTKLLPSLCLAFAAIACPAQDSGAQVPFAKVMNPVFAHEYQNTTVTTTAEFLTAIPQDRPWGSAISNLTAGLVPFCVLAPGQADPGVGKYPPYVFIPKAASDLVFELRKGELVRLTGHTVVDRKPTYLLIAFVADTVARIVPDPDK